MNTSLRGHVALVTGANHGIGASTAKMLAERGAAVVLTYLRISDPGDQGGPKSYRNDRASDAERVLAAVKELGRSGVAIEADLADADIAGRLFNTAEASFGPVDILINNDPVGLHSIPSWACLNADNRTLPQLQTADSRSRERLHRYRTLARLRRIGAEWRQIFNTVVNPASVKSAGDAQAASGGGRAVLSKG